MPSESPQPAEPSAGGKKTEEKGLDVKAIPLPLALALVVLALVGGYALFLWTMGPSGGIDVPDKPKTPAPLDKPPLDVTLLYSEACTLCSRATDGTPEHTLLHWFEQEGIRFNLATMETGSEEGAALAREYRVQAVPSLLIDEKQAKNYPDVEPRLRQYFDYRNGKFIALEPNLDRVYHARYFLEPDAVSCLMEEHFKPRVIVYDDPYCSSCYAAKPSLDKALALFAATVDFNYAYIPTSSDPLIQEYGETETEYAAKKILCAETQGKQWEVENQIRVALCDATNDGKASDVELESCMESKKFLRPLAKSEIDHLLEPLSLNKETMDTCFTKVNDTIVTDFRRALRYQLRNTPLALVNCQHIVHVSELPGLLCSLYPETEGCDAL